MAFGLGLGRSDWAPWVPAGAMKQDMTRSDAGMADQAKANLSLGIFCAGALSERGGCAGG